MLNSKGFDMWANGYDKTVRDCVESGEYPFAGYKEVLNTVYDRIESAEGKTVLDIGFGTGILTKKLYDDGIKIYGIDFSDEMIRIAKEKMPEAVLLKHDFTEGLPLELKGKKFDFIISTYAIHHLTDNEKAAFIKVLKAHLTDKGEILFGDVAFDTRKNLELCRSRAGDDWDKDEIYIVKEDLQKEIPDIEFKKISFCSGVCIIRNGLER